ncbi:MAG: hypothetical protein ACSHXD_05140 [Marinosulfonomonas sp.]
MTLNPQNSVRKRRVFYIPGYDPFPPRRYRELYRREGAAQAAISGYDIALKSRDAQGGYGWTVRAEIDGNVTETQYDVLVWSDLVQDSMTSTIPGTYWMLLRTSWLYISTGTLRRLMWLRKGPVIAAFYPIAVLLAQLVVLAGVAWGIGTIVANLTHPVLGWPLGAVILVAGLRFCKRHDRKLFAYYLMQDYAFSAGHGGANPPELDQRLDIFKDAVSGALDSDVDEVLVVGHSSGAQLAVNVLADLLRERPATQDKPELALLSLGQAIPMVSFLPKANKLRADLQYLSRSADVTWVDVSAPGDGCSFALCDPVAVSGVATGDKRWPLVFSAAFTKSLKPETWKKLKRRYFRLHFQYLCAFDRPRDYDYFQISAGPVTLAERYKDRPPSKSRIDVPASRYRSVAR